MIVTLSADRTTVTMRETTGWRRDIPLADLPKQLALYRGLRDRGGNGRPGPYAKWYEPIVTALERVEKMSKVMG